MSPLPPEDSGKPRRFKMVLYLAASWLAMLMGLMFYPLSYLDGLAAGETWGYENGIRLTLFSPVFCMIILVVIYFVAEKPKRKVLAAIIAPCAVAVANFAFLAGSPVNMYWKLCSAGFVHRLEKAVNLSETNKNAAILLEQHKDELQNSGGVSLPEQITSNPSFPLYHECAAMKPQNVYLTLRVSGDPVVYFDYGGGFIGHYGIVFSNIPISQEKASYHLEKVQEGVYFKFPP